MAENSSIEWCDHTFNPWIGCTKISEGCKFCYAEALMDNRYKKVQWGPQGRRVLTSEANWKQPYKWQKQAKELNTRHKVFCASLADVFEDKDDQFDEMNLWRHNLGKVIFETPDLDWLLLTKRPQNATDMLTMMFHDVGLIPDNASVGTSVENQKTANERIPELLKIPAKVRFLSCEPLLGEIELSYDALNLVCPTCDGDGYLKENHLDHPKQTGDDEDCDWCLDCNSQPRLVHGIDWVIVRGESGRGARPFDIAWLESLLEQCDGICPVFFKQLGSFPIMNEAQWRGLERAPLLKASQAWQTPEKYVPLLQHDSKGGNPDEWPNTVSIKAWNHVLRVFPDVESPSNRVRVA
jgi:protein gp37